MVSEEQCEFFALLSFQGLCSDCLWARICCASIYFRLTGTVLPSWLLALWKHFWLLVERSGTPAVAGCAIDPILDELPRDVGTKFCYCVAYSPSLYMLWPKLRLLILELFILSYLLQFLVGVCNGD